ncbi:hypothetical protein D9M70_555810 [compost metagenome]
MGLHAHATDGKPGETGAIFSHCLEPGHRDGFGLRGAVNIDELGQHVLDAVLVDDALRFSWQHGSSLLEKGQGGRWVAGDQGQDGARQPPGPGRLNEQVAVRLFH